jgi:DNA-binding MarR family transcriptional regulator
LTIPDNTNPERPSGQLVYGPGALKKLSPKHRTIVAYAMRGMTTREIAEKVGMRDTSISRILNSQLAKDAIKKLVSEMDDRFLMLKRKAIDAFEEALEISTPIETRLAAADKWFKAHGYYERSRKKEGGISLEDIVASLIANVQVNVQVNNTKDEDIDNKLAGSPNNMSFSTRTAKGDR